VTNTPSRWGTGEMLNRGGSGGGGQVEVWQTGHAHTVD